MKRGSGPIIGDVVTLPDFAQSSLKFILSSSDDEFAFTTRRIEQPDQMAINGKALGGSTRAQVQSLNF